MAKKILVVDDEEDITASIKTLLENAGYAVRVANSGKEALRSLQNERYDLVLLDILMPEMSGNEVAEKIRLNPQTQDQPIAFLSVVTLGEAGRALIQTLKPVAYIQKPFKTAEFKAQIARLVGHR